MSRPRIRLAAATLDALGGATRRYLSEVGLVLSAALGCGVRS